MTRENKSTIAFKLASEIDKNFLLALRKSSMDDHLITAGIVLNDQQHMQRIDEFFSDSHLILRNNQRIGLLKLGMFSDRIHIRQFQLLPDCHGLGIGSLILNMLKRKAITKQVSITLNVLLDNPAKELYLRHDFVVTGVNELEYAMRWQRPY
jgi:ribosomal protein S18 acetylase RimI-like enzyme